MSERRRVDVGFQGPGLDAIHSGEVRDGGGRIKVWTSDTDSPYRVSVVGTMQLGGRLLDGEGYGVEDVQVMGSASLGLSGRLSAEQAEALIVELQLAVRASRLRDGKPWAGREIAPGVLRAPATKEAA